MKWLIVASFVAAPALAGWVCLAEYWSGHSETWAAFDRSDPIINFFADAIVFLFILGVFFSALWKRRWRIPAACALLAFWPVGLLVFSLLPAGGKMIVHGLRDRVLHDYSQDDLRHFAQAANQQNLVGLNLSLGRNGDHLAPAQRAAYDDLRRRYPFLDWMGMNGHGTTVIENFDDPSVVDFEWGGALMGHWGCSIRVDGKRSDPPAGEFFYVLRASDDIYFYFE